MNSVPKSLRVHIGIFGRMNVGKSSFLNMLMDQQASITSELPGTTTDVVERAMELLPLGPVVFHDTAGIDDQSRLSQKRIEKTEKVFHKSDIFVLLLEAGQWGEYEERIFKKSLEKKVPLVLVINKIDLKMPAVTFVDSLKGRSQYVMQTSCLPNTDRDAHVNQLKEFLSLALKSIRGNEITLIGDLIPPGGIGILIVPIDLQAPKGRLILPQVQTIRDALDNDGAIMVVK